MSQLRERRRGPVSRVFFRGCLLCVLVLMTSAVIWICIGATHWGSHLLIGPGYAGTLLVEGSRLTVTPGWRRTVRIDLPEASWEARFPGDPFGYELPAEYNSVDDVVKPQTFVAIRYHSGFVLIIRDPIETSSPVPRAGAGD